MEQQFINKIERKIKRLSKNSGIPISTKKNIIKQLMKIPEDPVPGRGASYSSDITREMITQYNNYRDICDIIKLIDKFKTKEIFNKANTTTLQQKYNKYKKYKNLFPTKEHSRSNFDAELSRDILDTCLSHRYHKGLRNIQMGKVKDVYFIKSMTKDNTVFTIDKKYFDRLKRIICPLSAQQAFYIFHCCKNEITLFA